MRFVIVVLVSAAAMVGLASWVRVAHAAPSVTAAPAPEFTHAREQDWLNSKPLSLKDLRGSVVLLDFWAFECWNCYRSFPWLNAVADNYRERGLVVVSVHTPELPSEHDRSQLIRKSREYGLTNPIMLDDDHSYWNAMGNTYWPAFYLIDRQGRVRSVFLGETHAGDDNARALEAALEQLLSEAGGGPALNSDS